MVLWEGLTGLCTSWCGFEVTLLVDYLSGRTRDVWVGSWLAVAGLTLIPWLALRVAAGWDRTYIGREGTQGNGGEASNETAFTGTPQALTEEDLANISPESIVDR